MTVNLSKAPVRTPFEDDVDALNALRDNPQTARSPQRWAAEAAFAAKWPIDEYLDTPAALAEVASDDSF